MKILSVFSIVIIFHITILGLLLIQPGCQSKPKDSGPPATATPTPPSTEPAQLDPAFNAGLNMPASTPRRNLSAPTRPETDYRNEPATGQLEPVLDPVQDTYSLPAATREITVQAGDTPSGIAKREGISLNDLLAANKLNRNSVIYVGQTLYVPEATAPNEVLQAEIEHSGKTVVVRSGDTLSAIAARHGTTVGELKAVNGLTRDTIFVGQKLLLPETAASPSGTPAQTVRQPQASFAAGQNTYTVKAGDTPSSIARMFGISSRELMTANNITDPRKLYIGRNLVIPAQGTSPSAPPRTPSTQVTTPASRPVTTQPSGMIQAPVTTDPELDAMSTLEALEDEDLPYVEVEVVEEPPQN